jgi:plasmid rolling circle replication initiator protein Rep
MQESCQEHPGSSPYLTDISKSDKPWDKHRRNSGVVQNLYLSSELPQYGERMKQCANQLGFILEAKDEGEARFRLSQARFCRVRHCPVCQWRRTLVWRARLINALPKVLEAHPKSRWIFVTLTVRNCPLTELRTTIDGMNKAWSRLVKRKDFPAIGFLRSLEVTAAYDVYDGSRYLGRHGLTYVTRWEKKHPRRKLRLEPTQEAHPHFHALLMVNSSYFKGSSYLSQQKWRELWGSCLKVDYLPVVNVKTAKDKTGQDSVIHAVLETAKYSVKEEDLTFSVEWLQELTIQLHKTRAINVGGILKEYLKDEEPEDLIHTNEEEKPVVEDTATLLWFDWMSQVKRYQARK